ncbi:MAG: ABC transporter permease [Rhodobacteraceae bacterium]|nr:ABC transporter permease [Paracoccaceae bacterium]
MDTFSSLPAPPPMPPPMPPKARAPRFRRLRVLSALVIREMDKKFGRSVGGYAWALAEPLGGILLLSIVFSLALRSPPLGTSFMLFYMTGIIPFYMFNTMAKGVAGAVKSNRGLLNYPVVTALDAVFAKFVLNFMTILLVAVALSTGIIVGGGLHVNLDLGAAAVAFVSAAALGLGVGATNCVLFGLFPTWSNIWGVLTRPLFLLSSIFYTFESAPASFQAVLWWNPLVHVVATMRTAFYGTYDPQFVSLPYVWGIALGLFVVGAYLLRRHTSLLLDQ